MSSVMVVSIMAGDGDATNDYEVVSGSIWVEKGTRIEAEWFQATDAALTGVAPKVGAELIRVCGVVRHIHVDRPVEPTVVELLIDAERDVPGVLRYACPRCNRDHLIVKPEHVVSGDVASSS